MLKVVIRGLPSCFEINMKTLNDFLSRRAPGTNPFSSKRMEKDTPVLISGGAFRENITESGNAVLVTNGDPLILAIKNTDVRKKDYSNIRYTPRPGHADFTAPIRYPGIDMSGAGPFSGRMTAPLCIAGGIAIQFLEQLGITIGAHIVSVGDVSDELFDPTDIKRDYLKSLTSSFFPAINDSFRTKAESVIYEASDSNDSVGGVIEIAAVGVPAGLGGAMNQGMESIIAHSMFGIPAVKGVEFGNGFACAKLTGSENNDPFIIKNKDENISIKSSELEDNDSFDVETGSKNNLTEAFKYIGTSTNNHGGILGGITTGMPLICRVAFKPTPSIGKTQTTVDLRTMKSTAINVSGRHDPCIVPRAVPVCEAVLAMSLIDAYLENRSLLKEPADDNNSLAALRSRIDEIDKSLLDSFMARMSIVSQIAEYKKEKKLSVLNEDREKDVLKKIRKMSDAGLSDYSEEFFSEIMRLSKKYQNELINCAINEND